MKNLRRWAVGVLALTLSSGLAACGRDGNGADGQKLTAQRSVAESGGHEEGHTPLGDLSKVGMVEFPSSCDPAVQPDFKRAVALLHSFFYESPAASSPPWRTGTRAAASPIGVSP